MGSGKISKKVLKKLGLSHLENELKISMDERIEDGKNRRRQFLQQVKNDVIRQEKEKGLRSEETWNFFDFREKNQDYSSFKNHLLKRDWKDIDLD